MDSDPMLLQNFDNPSMALVSAPFVGANYFTLSRYMTLALRVKDKLDLINGSVKVPIIGTSEYEKWMRADSMVS